MSTNEIHVDDIGTKFSITIKDGDLAIDLSSSINIILTFRKPSDELITRTASFVTDGTNGQIYYDTEPGDLEEAGYYKLQAKVTFPNGVFYTNIHTFQVHCNL